jgi:hypothetical protein
MSEQPQTPPQNQPKSTPTARPARKGEQDSHAAGSGSSTGDPGKARGPAPDAGAIPID